jgi:hypothetical protein
MYPDGYAAALHSLPSLDGQFEHPARRSPIVLAMRIIAFPPYYNSFASLVNVLAPGVRDRLRLSR